MPSPPAFRSRLTPWALAGVVGAGIGAACAGDALPAVTPSVSIPQIQGRGAISPWLGRRVSTHGVVTQVGATGYFLQDADGDGDAATSDGIYVHTGTAPGVRVGRRLQLTARVDEHNVGAADNASTRAHPLTLLTSASGVVDSGEGAVSPAEIALPLSAGEDLERYEGMLVRLRTPMVVTQSGVPGHDGQVLLAPGARLEQPTNRYRPGSEAAAARRDLNGRSLLMLDRRGGGEGSLRGGDTVTGLTGVLDVALVGPALSGAARDRLRPTVAPAVLTTHPRTAQPASVHGDVRVASFNVLNYFTTFGDGRTAGGAVGRGCAPSFTTADCRGADDATQFARQRARLVAALIALDADVVGLMELQNEGDVALRDLVDGLNAQFGAGRYAAVPAPAEGTGSDAIRVGLIYRPARVAPDGASVGDASPVHHRAPLAQRFRVIGGPAAGQGFGVVVNHFKSKVCVGAHGGDVDRGDGQGCYNDRRSLQAEQLLRFLDALGRRTGEARWLVVGDLNAYTCEDPVQRLVTGGPLVDLVARHVGPGAYSYVHDALSGTLDHALATPSLAARVSGVTQWHINADEPAALDYRHDRSDPAAGPAGPYRASDHDPVLVGLQLAPGAVALPAAPAATCVDVPTRSTTAARPDDRRSRSPTAGRSP